MFYSMHTVLLVVGLAVAAVLCALGISGLMLLWDKRKPQKGYDERQVLHRGRAATLGCLVSIGYGVALMVWEGAASWPAEFIGYVGIWLTALVVVTYCVLTESLIRPGEKYRWIGVVLLFAGVADLISFYHKNQELSWYVEKGLEVAAHHRHFANLLMGVTFLFWGVLVMITQWRYSRE